jgi:hypothetical protein
MVACLTLRCYKPYGEMVDAEEGKETAFLVMACCACSDVAPPDGGIVSHSKGLRM